MKIKKIKIENYRLLKDFEIDLEDQLSLIIGKNNTGKTSLLSLLEKFLASESHNLTLDDINIDLQQDILEAVRNKTAAKDSHMGIDMKLYIEYHEEDNLANISKLMLNLDPSDNVVVINFAYKISPEGINNLRDDYEAYEAEHGRPIQDYVKLHHKKHFEAKIYALESGNEQNYAAIGLDEVRRVIAFGHIKASRGVDNSTGAQKRSNAVLSSLSSKHYDKESKLAPGENEGIAKLREHLMQADEQLTEAYGAIFKEIVEKIKKFGGLPEDDLDLEVISALDENSILKDNTLVTYAHKEGRLPEDHNGLGYMNLIYMIFEIVGTVNNFKNKYSDKGVLADICLFFIEEPEVHTHPQMQYIFIKNIKDLLRESSRVSETECLNLQTIMSTHSSHIASESDFGEVRYLYVNRNNSSVESKNFADLEKICTDEGHYGFLKKYLTLNRAELLFADKVVLIEGDTERILIPTIMKKIDMESEQTDSLPLMSQNISIIEAGAYSHIFQHLVHFLEISKCLIVTDIDSGRKNKQGQTEMCPVEPIEQDKESSNSAIKYFLSDKDYNQICVLPEEERTLACNSDDGWRPDKDGNLRITYQQKEGDYHARSFEDAFISINRGFISTNLGQFRSLKSEPSSWSEDSPYCLAKKVKKKTDFALDIIYLSDDKYSNWLIPGYIVEGLRWLRD